MKLSKPTLIKLLTEDFEREFPDSNRATKAMLSMQLSSLDIKDLELLVSQLPKSILDQLPERPK